MAPFPGPISMKLLWDSGFIALIIWLITVASVKKFCPKLFLALDITYLFFIKAAISVAAIRLDSSAFVVALLS